MLPSLYHYYAIITKVPWLSARLRNINRKIVHSAIKRKEVRFHGVLKYTGACVCVCMYDLLPTIVSATNYRFFDRFFGVVGF